MVLTAVRMLVLRCAANGYNFRDRPWLVDNWKLMPALSPGFGNAVVRLTGPGEDHLSTFERLFKHMQLLIQI